MARKRLRTVIPTVLARDRGTFQRRLKAARRLSRSVHLDVMDGRFVTTRSVGPAALRHLPSGVYELHCMVADPLPWVAVAVAAKIKRVIIHAESPSARQAVLAARRFGLACAIALRPSTPWRRAKRFHGLIDRVVCMGVQPGANGRPWQRGVLVTLRALRRHWPAIVRGVDGGVSLKTIAAVREAGAEVCAVGSAIQRSSDPRAAYHRLRRQLRA